MPEPTLENVFGPGATQEADTLTISKSALAAVGLTPQAVNNAEGLLAAILRVAANTLTTANQQLNPDQHCSIQNANATVWTSPYGERLRHNLLVSFDSDFTDPGIIPDNY